MRFVRSKVLISLVMMLILQGALANGLPPYTVSLNCDPAQSEGNPPLEPFNGESKVQMVYLGNEEFCYRIKFRCDSEFVTPFGVELTCFCADNPNPPDGPTIEADGGVGVNMFTDSGDGFCGFGGAHLRNNEFSHSCSFEDGDVSLRVERVYGEMCNDLPPPAMP